jgi:NAD(P)-dependent dehydrogenase (short-subunit alcohol dehydrogenase family)
MKKILITGAGGGIGKAIIPVLFEMGHELFLTTRSSSDDLKDFCAEKGIPARIFSADLRVENDVESLFSWIGEHGGIDVLVNNAGIAHAAASWKLGADEMHELMEVNFYSAVRCTQRALVHMRAQEYGRIISISSVVAHKPSFGTSGYAASKSALEGYTRGVALDTASKGITANVLAYGYMEAGMLHDVPKAMLEEVKKTIPAGGFGRPEQIANLIQMLIESEFTTGQTIHVNGGQWMP